MLLREALQLRKSVFLKHCLFNKKVEIKYIVPVSIEKCNFLCEKTVPMVHYLHFLKKYQEFPHDISLNSQHLMKWKEHHQAKEMSIPEMLSQFSKSNPICFDA